MSGMPLRVRVLGGFSVDGVDEHALGSRKGRQILKVLVLERGRPVAVDRLVDVLWGDAPPSSPAEQVGVLVSRLRRVLGGERVVRTDAGYLADVDWLDVDELAARVAEARGALAAGRLAAARAAADASVRLHRGTVLPEEDGAWVEAERAAAEALVSEARRMLAEAAQRAGDHGAAAAAAQAALAADPYDEAVLRVLMRADAAAGRPASALAAYARTRARLAEDLGVSPMRETEALHEEILLAEDAPPAEGARRQPPRPAGRDAEVDALDAALERCASSGTVVTVVVEGEVGIGKTTLLESWLAGAASRAQVLVGRGGALRRELPLQPVLDAVGSHVAGLAPGDRAALLGREAAVLEPLLGLGEPAPAGSATVVTDPELARMRLFVALRAVVAGLASARPAVLAVDDVHLAGEATLAWLDFAAQAPARLLLVVTTTPAFDAGLRSATRITLAPLDVDAVGAVVGADRATELHALSGGHPLLLAALARNGGARGGAARHEADLAPTLAEAVERRIAALGGAAATVRTAAVLGPEVDLDLLAEVVRAPATTLLEHLEAGVLAGLLVERGAGFAFRHQLEREQLEASTGSARRALVHREAARALADRPVPDPLAVAEHARLGGEDALAVEWYVRAADVALARADPAAAEALLDLALDLGGHRDVLVARARVRIAAGRPDDAAVDAGRALAVGRDPVALEVAGWAAYYRRRYDEARAFADEGVHLAADAGVRTSCLSLVGRVRHAAGDLPGAVACLEAAAATPARTSALASVWLAHARLHQGRPADALAALRDALDDRHLSHPFAPLHARFARAMALGQLGRVGEALTACDELDAAVAGAAPAGARFVGPAANCRGWLLRWSGHLDEADASNEGAVERAEAEDFAEAFYAGLLDLADGRLLAGRSDAAADLVARLAPVEVWQGTMAWHQRHRYELLQARLALLDGDRDAAVARSAAVAADAAARGARRYELFARAVSALAGGPEASDVDVCDGVVRGLGSCAVLDGWWTVAQLADHLGVPAWRAQAGAAVAAVLRSSPDSGPGRRLAERVLG